jgi:hypothetical protein
MQTSDSRLRRVPLKKKPLVAAIVAVASYGAFAQEAAPTNYVGARETVGRDSNVYRVPDGPHDYFYSTSLLGGVDQTISRQRLYATAEADFNRYHNATALNNTSYAVKGGWDWATIGNLTGTVTANANQSLASLYGNASIPTTARNLAKSDQIAASAKWGGEGLLSLEGNYGHSRVSYSAPEYINQKSSADTYSLGGFYRAGPTLRLGAAGRFTRVEQPNAISDGAGGFFSETTDGRNLDLTADWQYSVQTNVNARLSYTKQTSSGASQSGDFSGLTGAVYANYAPTAKLAFSAAFIRDAGINPTFFNVVNAPPTNTGPSTSTVGLSEASQISNTVVLGLKYAVTAKIAATVGYQYRLSKTDATQFVVSTHDKLQDTSLGVAYDITRNWQLSCAFQHEARNVTGAPSFAYNSNMTSCAAQFLLR